MQNTRALFNIARLELMRTGLVNANNPRFYRNLDFVAFRVFLPVPREIPRSFNSMIFGYDGYRRWKTRRNIGRR